MSADPHLIARWADACAISRGAAMPVSRDGGLYIHVGSEKQVVFDQIGTAERYQRRGLGSAIMRALAAHAHDRGIRDAMLCATPPGRAIYTALGWSLHSDYSTASLAS